MTEYDRPMALDERSFFSDKPETRSARYACTRCHRTNEYSVRWVRRVKKDRLPGGADELDRAKFAKLRDHLIRVDDELVCKACGKKFEIPSLHSLLFVDQLEGLPKDEEELEAEADNRESVAGNRESGAAKEAVAQDKPAKPKLSARFTRPTGWRG